MMDAKKLEGKWQVEMPDLAKDYLDLPPDPHVHLKIRSSGEVNGTYEFGAQSGELDGQIEEEGDQIVFTFTFEGQDELDSVHGFGTATLIDESTLKGVMHYHRADTYLFTWKRVEHPSQIDFGHLDR